ncbi:MaoC/PaaZ C-terminal domain-containing protein [Variovorax sp. KK3]|uniref:MaoC/PaaZ C-terminal domain-containing protein n=1 Tax=Variovorax sp. KK3 TaxID=1855728 RepID=UPI00097BBB32|nr:MaoC/PaaZ C-terminal domain-containing protein [Variovorax sp. KK3]
MNGPLFAMKPGESLSMTLPPVTTTQLVQYAGASGDFNRIHYDHPFAVEAQLGGVIAHGMLTMAFMGRAVGEWAGTPGRVKNINARFTSPVRPGDRVRVQATVTAPEATGHVACTLEAWVEDTRVAVGEALIAR